MNPLKTIHDLVVSFFSRFVDYAIRYPRRVLVIAALVTLAAAPGIGRLRLRTDGHALVSPSAPEVLFDKKIRAQFGIEDQLVVLIESTHQDGIFNPATLQLVRKLTADVSHISGINPSNVLSLATEPSFRLRPSTLIRKTLLESPLQTKAELDQLREDLRRIELYTGTFVSSDGKSTCILIGTPDHGDRTRLYQNVLAVIAALGPAAEDITVTGAPVAESLLGIHILEDLGVPKALLGTSTRSHTEKAEREMPANFYELRLLIARRIGLVAVAVIVMMLVFLVSFRNVAATLLPLPEVAATLLFVFGLMGWLGVPIYLTIAVMPVLLTAMCVTDEIHIFSRYFSLLREKPGVPHVELVKEAMNDLVRPVANTTLTTAVGFVSFSFSPLEPVQAFGIFTAIGVLFSLFYSLTVIPAMLVLINPEWLVSRRQRETTNSGSLGRWFAHLGQSVVRRRGWAIALVLVFVALTPLGLRRLVVQDSWIDGFDPDSEFRRVTQLVNEDFYGMHLLLVSAEKTQRLHGKISSGNLTAHDIVVPGALVENAAVVAGSTIWIRPVANSDPGRTTNSIAVPTWQTHIEMTARRGNEIVARLAPGKAPGPDFWRAISETGQAQYEIVARSHFRPDVIRNLQGLASFIRERSQHAVGGVLGPYEYLETTRFMARPDDPKARQLGDDPAEIKLMWDFYGLARGPARLRQIVDTNYWQSLTTVFLKNANFIDTARLMNDIRAYEREKLAPQGITLGFAGDVAVSQSLISSIVTTQLQSLVGSLVGICLVTGLMGRSWQWGMFCVLPSLLAVVFNFAVMGWFGIPLGVATSMFAGMTLGIGVDFAIHLVESYSRARISGATQIEALARSMALSGPPVLINTLAISFGFGVLMLSQVPANARLGLLTVLGLVNCLIASLLLLPVLLHWSPLMKREAKSIL